MPVFRRGGLELHYLVRGRGEPVVLIHGLASSGADWTFQVPALEPYFRVLVPDLPGSGHSAPPGGGYSIKSMAEAVWLLLDHLEVTRANVIGFSLGGAVALEMALQRPESVPRLALINSLASYRIDHWRKWFHARLSAAIVRTLGMSSMARVAADQLFPQSWQQPMHDRAVEVISRVPAATYLGMARALEHWSAADRLHQLQGRVLLIAGQHDYTSLEEKRQLAEQVGGEFAVIRGSRHGTPFDSIDVTNTLLLALLTDEKIPSSATWMADGPERQPAWPTPGSVFHEHAAGP